MAFMIMFRLLLLLLLLSFILDTASAQPRNSTIRPGSFLSPSNNSFWLSESGRFAFGLYPNGNGFSVGIWFEKIQQKTVVWTANRDDPPFPNDVTLLLSIEGRLLVQTKQGQEILISNPSQPASSASMLDSGNFVLFNSISDIVWQSFDAPTDTMLPGQRLVSPNKMVSSVSQTNHSSGKFQIVMQVDGNLVQYPAETREVGTAYWATLTNHAGGGVTLNLDSNGLLYLQNATGFNIKYINDNVFGLGKSMYRATIDPDGIFRLYSHTSNHSDNWSIEWSSSDNKCEPKGLCGVNSYCLLINGAPVCQCPPHFDFINEEQKDMGCRKSYNIDACSKKSEQTFDFYELINVTWKDDAYSSFSSMAKNACRDECYKDCYCEAAFYENQLCKLLK